MSIMDAMQIDCAEMTVRICNFIQKQVNNFHKEGIILGLSGGIDSSCVAALSVKAIGKDKVLGLIMPERDSANETIDDAKLVATHYGIETKLIDITPILENFHIYNHIVRCEFPLRKISEKIIRIGYRLFPTTKNPFVCGMRGNGFHWLRRMESYYRIKNRIRMVNLYYHGERRNYLIVGTSNRTEELVGFFVKYGDGAADIMPIAHIYKTQVRELSYYLGIPDPVMKKEPSPDLIQGITDELALGISYNELDIILSGLESGKNEKEINFEMEIPISKIQYVQMLVNLSEPMRRMPLKLKE